MMSHYVTLCLIIYYLIYYALLITPYILHRISLLYHEMPLLLFSLLLFVVAGTFHDCDCHELAVESPTFVHKQLFLMGRSMLLRHITGIVN